MSQGIYKITNIINNKCYIGKSQNIQDRWEQHIYDYRNNRYPDKPLYKAFKKYGLTKFSFEIIESIQNYTKEKSDDREKYWIQYYNSYGSTGYNASPGGEGGNICDMRSKIGKLTTEEVIYLRKRYQECKYPWRLIYNKEFKDKITERGFQAIWKGQNSKKIMPQVFTQENKQKQHKLLYAYNGCLRRKMSLQDLQKARILAKKYNNPKKVWEEKFKHIYSYTGFRDALETIYFDEKMNLLEPLAPLQE